MTFASSFGRAFSPTFQPNSQAAAAGGGWWDLNGTITSCVAAYQPKGAASLAASYDNLTGNATYDAAEGAAQDWNSTDGWVFRGRSYLMTGVVPNGGSYSAIVRYSGENVAANRVFGAESGAVRFFIIPNYEGLVYYANGATATNAPQLASGILAVAGNKGYRDGSFDVDIAAYSGTISQDIYIGGVNDDGSPARLIVANIQAFAIYNAALTSTQISNLTTAMNAL